MFSKIAHQAEAKKPGKNKHAVKVYVRPVGLTHINVCVCVCMLVCVCVYVSQPPSHVCVCAGGSGVVGVGGTRMRP